MDTSLASIVSLQYGSCMLGLALSFYAFYIESRKHRDPKYTALCDLGPNMQCSTVLTSTYSQGFGLMQYLVDMDSVLNVPNCVTGIIFYSLMLFLSWWINVPEAVFSAHALAWTAVIGSLYLAVILFFVLKDVCLVCIATYIVNFVLLYTTGRIYHVMF